MVSTDVVGDDGPNVDPVNVGVRDYQLHNIQSVVV